MQKVVCAAALAAMTFALVPRSGAQAAVPAFDVVSVKPSTGRPGRVRFYPGRFTADGTNVLGLIAAAYQLQRNQVVGGPNWVRSEGYDVEGKANGPAGKEDLVLMSRTMLSQRFNLKFHREPRETPVYALVAAKGGAKVRKVREGDVTPADDGKPHRMHLQTDMAGLASALYGFLQVTLPNPETGLPIAVGSVLPVVDETGLEGVYDVTLETHPDTDTFSTWQDALQPLGLRMVPQKRPVMFLVIDSVDRPSLN